MNELFVALVLSWAVIDGDTMQVTARVWPGHVFEGRVRLLRVDTPEPGGKAPPCERALAAVATSYTRNALSGAGVIVVKGRRRDSFGRVLGEVYLDGQNFNDRLLRDGVGRPPAVNGPWC